MPVDIRNFFGGGPPKSSAGSTASAKRQDEKKPTKKESGKGRGRARKVVSDDEEEREEEEVVKPQKSAPAKPKKEPKPVAQEEETTSSAYFAGSKSKSKAERNQSSTTKTTNGAVTTPKKGLRSNGTTPASTRSSARKATKKRYKEDDDDDVRVLDDTKDGGHDDIHAEDYKNGRKGDDYEEASDDEDEVIPVSRSRKSNGIKGRTSRAVKDEDDEDEDVEMQDVSKQAKTASSKTKPAPKASTTGRKRKAKDDDEDDKEDDETPKKKAKKAAAPKPRQKKDDATESKEMQDLMNNIPTVRAPTPPPRDDSKTFQFKPGGGNTSAMPVAAGSKEIPEGNENCLAGLNFVFTGVLDTLGREEGQQLVKRYGGKVTGAPSRNTSFVVLGNEAGPKKLETIKKLGIKTIDEDGLFHIIKTFPANGGDSKAAAKQAEKKAAEEAKMKAEAEEMERKEKEKEREAQKAAKAAATRNGAPAPPSKPAGPRVEDKLWVDKYAPDSMNSVCGNKALVEKLQSWLRLWPKRHKFGFKQAGPDGSGIYRAAMLHGPPGVGKTTAAHLVAKLEGFDVVESNASDTRSKKLVENGLTGVLDTTSLLGYFAGDGKKVDASKRKLVLIMDEVDGMSAGDRGGVGALAAVAKKTNIPMILICNDRRLPKMKPFDFVTADFPFRRPTVDMIRGRVATICYREGIKLPPPAMNAIIEGCHGDIRQIINMISTIKVDSKSMDFSDSKAMSKAWEKHIILKPWDIVNKILRPEMFSGASQTTLNEKTELYFNDHEFSYLMLQENYLKTKMVRANQYSGKQHALKLLELADSAAESISDGDLVDRMIHGTQQQWSLMPTHAMFSFVRPASFTYGQLGQQVGFTSWLGNNSKQGKLSRLVKEIQGHMRLRTSGDRHEIRQQYLPALWNRTVNTLQKDGKESVQEVIDFMDTYYLTKDDFDAVLELGVGPMDQEKVKLDTQTKTTFTRIYNQQSHPMPFIKASASGSAAAKMGGSGKRDKPDLEEAVDESDDGGAADAVDPEADADEAEDEELDLKKDKYVKVPKKKAAPKKGGGSKGKGKGKKAKDDDDGDEDDVVEGQGSEDEAPKTKRGGAGGNGRGRGGGRGRGRGK